MSQVKLIVSNWKMNLNFKEAKILINNLKKINFKTTHPINIICPQFILLPLVSNLLLKSSFILGAQDCHYKKKGAFTGDTSIELIKKIGCKYIIVGHSERRQQHKETDKTVKKKVDLILFEKLKPIICIGESEIERKKKSYLKILQKQLDICVPKNLNEIIIAYEPIWAIGTGLTPTLQEIIEVKEFVYDFLKNNKNINKVIFLYGGSVNAQNAKDILIGANVDGSLIGGSSIKIEEMNKILTLG